MTRMHMPCCRSFLSSAMGRIMLAYMPEAKAEDILKRSNREKRTPDTKVGVIPEMNNGTHRCPAELHLQGI